MDKQITDEQTLEIAKQKISEEQKRNLRLFEKRKNSMIRAEEELIVTFDERQLEYYAKFSRRRSKFYEIADKIYAKTYDNEEE